MHTKYKKLRMEVNVMVGYYIHCELIRKGVYYAGVDKKIKQQMKEFSKIAIMNDITLKSKSYPILKRLPGRSRLYYWENVYNEIKEQPDFIYIRKEIFDQGVIDFFSFIKKKFPTCKILIEIPTYPYDGELFSKKINLSLYLKDRSTRKKFKDYVEKIVTYSDDLTIFGINTIIIQNGVDVSNFPVIIPRKKDEEIHLLAVAALQSYHGYERIIEGIRQYYINGGKRTIKFYIVGQGDAQAKLKDMVNNYDLADNVIFFGTKTGDELTEIFNQADIGMGSFGFYKIGLDKASSLKTREYLARGLPVVSGCRQDIFEIAPCDYHLEFSNDNSPVDIQKIIEFYDKLFTKYQKMDVFSKIREYAEENVIMEKAFAPVIEYLKTQIDIESKGI